MAHSLTQPEQQDSKAIESADPSDALAGTAQPSGQDIEHLMTASLPSHGDSLFTLAEKMRMLTEPFTSSRVRAEIHLLPDAERTKIRQDAIDRASQRMTKGQAARFFAMQSGTLQLPQFNRNTDKAPIPNDTESAERYQRLAWAVDEIWCQPKAEAGEFIMNATPENVSWFFNYQQPISPLITAVGKVHLAEDQLYMARFQQSYAHAIRLTDNILRQTQRQISDILNTKAYLLSQLGSTDTFFSEAMQVIHFTPGERVEINPGKIRITYNPATATAPRVRNASRHHVPTTAQATSTPIEAPPATPIKDERQVKLEGLSNKSPNQIPGTADSAEVSETPTITDDLKSTTKSIKRDWSSMGVMDMFSCKRMRLEPPPRYAFKPCDELSIKEESDLVPLKQEPVPFQADALGLDGVVTLTHVSAIESED